SLNLNKNDFLWTSPISFVASANCGLYCGAKIDFVEIDLKTFNLSVQKLEQKLILAKKNNRLPKILVVVHLGGLSCNMHEIYKLSKKFGFKIIEDASHALGGSYRGFKVGSCKYSDITVFSFHPVKIITSGEGGVATTNNKKLADKMLMLREHGIIRDKSKFNGKSHGPWHYQQQYLGFNYRMSDIHAALGISQLKKINRFVKRRNEISKIYKKEFKKFKVLMDDKLEMFQPRNGFMVWLSFPDQLRSPDNDRIIVNLIDHLQPFQDVVASGLGKNSNGEAGFQPRQGGPGKRPRGPGKGPRGRGNFQRRGPGGPGPGQQVLDQFRPPVSNHHSSPTHRMSSE
ncbi:MAG TPA: hypothetical protein EYQ50_11205, partial [Verrucomicrobiales bacterium]|nr:hypothetical protein [Verrucomicrobiales bacterium]